MGYARVLRLRSGMAGLAGRLRDAARRRTGPVSELRPPPLGAAEDPDPPRAHPAGAGRGLSSPTTRPEVARWRRTARSRPIPTGRATTCAGLINAASAGRRGRETASAARSPSTRATPTRCRTTAGSCASNNRHEEAQRAVRAGAGQPAAARRRARTGWPRRVPSRAGRLKTPRSALQRAYQMDAGQPVDPVNPGRSAATAAARRSARAFTSGASTPTSTSANAQTLWLACASSADGNSAGGAGSASSC